MSGVRVSPRLALILSATALVAVIGGTAGWVLLRPAGDAYADCRGGAVAGGMGQVGGDFALVDGQGRDFTQDDLTAPSLIYFGYTFCPDVCPLDNARNAAATEILEADGLMVTPVFISIDPDRDTTEVVAEFAYNFHDRMIGLTGTPEQTQAASRAFKTYYRAQGTLEDDPYYLVDHSTFTYLWMPGQGVVSFFRHDDTPETVAEGTACFIKASERN